MKRSEADLVKACLLFLRAKGIIAWRNNTGSWKEKGRFIRFGHPGSGDILGIHPKNGKFISIECKVLPNKISNVQVTWIRKIAENGGIAGVVYSVDDLERIV